MENIFQYKRQITLFALSIFLYTLFFILNSLFILYQNIRLNSISFVSFAVYPFSNNGKDTGIEKQRFIPFIEGYGQGIQMVFQMRIVFLQPIPLFYKSPLLPALEFAEQYLSAYLWYFPLF